ncbi:hypothetical protein OAV62_02090 [bacterium]|nr:hypothetical protein [bacterium]
MGSKYSEKNRVYGFSSRFSFFASLYLNISTGWGFYSKGSRALDLPLNSFKDFCVHDHPPAHNELLTIIDKLLQNSQDNFDSRIVASWLLFGNASPNPFGQMHILSEELLEPASYIVFLEIARPNQFNYYSLSDSQLSAITTQLKQLCTDKQLTNISDMEQNEEFKSICQGMIAMSAASA